MLKRQKQKTTSQQTQTAEHVDRKSKISILNSKLTTRILLLVLFITLFAGISFAWFSGIHIAFSPGLKLSTLSSLKNNVEVVGYGYNSEYDDDQPITSFLTDYTFKTDSELTEENTIAKNLFAGDYFEPGAINKIKRVDYATDALYNAAVNEVIANNTNTKYIKVTNKSDMDISVRTLFEMTDSTQELNDLAGFWYLIDDVTSEVNVSEGNSITEKLCNYASENPASRNNDYNENNPSANLFEKLTSKVKLGDILEAEDRNVGNTRIYRIDYGLSEFALRSSGDHYFGKKIEMNVHIYYGQTNAPEDDDTEVTTTIREVGTAEQLLSTLSNLQEAYNGDTIKLTADITINGPLTISRPFNFDLNGHNLTINGGDLTFSYNSTTSVTIDMTKKGSIHVIGKRGTTQAASYDGSIIINTPNSPITFIGDNAKTSGVDNYDIRLDGVGSIVNYSTSLKLTSTYIVQYTYDEINNYELIPFETVVTMMETEKGEGKSKTYQASGLTVGEFVDIDMVTSGNIHTCNIYNYGNLGCIYLLSMDIPNYNKQYLYIYNNGKIAGYTGTPSVPYDVTLPSTATTIRVKIVKGSKSNNFTMGGSNSFTYDDIEDPNKHTEVIVAITGETNSYYVYLNQDTATNLMDNSTLKYAFYEYFNNNPENFAGIKKLVIVGTKGVSINEYDINFLMTKSDDNFIFRDLAVLDLSAISIDSGGVENKIPNNAFLNKDSLTSVTLPEDIMYVGSYAFAGTSISKITIPSNVVQLGYNAFINVTDVTVNSFYPLANNNFLCAFPNYAYFFVDSTMVDEYKTQFGTNYGGVNFSKHVYRYAEHIDNSNFYIRVTNQANNQLEIVAYTGDIYGTSITPSTLEYLGVTYDVIGIGRDAYINMTNNQSITLNLSVGDDVDYIGEGAFTTLNFIVTVNTKAATSIGKRAFYGCDYVTTLIVDGSAELGEEAFASCTRLANVSLSRCIKIGDRTFSGDTSIVSLSIPKVREIGDSAFLGCYSFESVVFGELEVIGANTFKNCKALRTVVFSSVTQEIGESCFENCQSLVSIAGTTAGLEEYYIKLTDLKIIGKNAFKGCKAFKYVKATCLTTIGESAFNGCTSLEYVDAPTVITIGNEAFANLTNLSQVNVTAVQSIGNSAFYKTGIQYIDIPNAKTIGTYAFYDCSSIIEISFGKVDSIGNGAFYKVDPKYIDLSAYTYPSDLTVPDEPEVSTFAFGANNNWHRFSASVKYYLVGDSSNESVTTERKNYLYAALRTSYYTLYDDENEYYEEDERDNLEVDYLFIKDKFFGDWIISSSDNYLNKNINLYNIKITATTDEFDVTTYTGKILSYHGPDLVGNVVIPTQTYYPNGLPASMFNDKTSSAYNGIFNIEINGNTEQVAITSIGYYAYENVNGTGNNASLLEVGDIYCHVSFANTVLEICEGAFRYSTIDFVDMNKVQEIKQDAFRNTAELRYVDLGDCVTVGDYAFSSYSGKTSILSMYKQYGHNFTVSSFTDTMMTKIVFRHVDNIGECSFYFNYLSNTTFLILDFSENSPGLDSSYNSGYGPNNKLNAPSNCNEIWRGYSENLYYYNTSYYTSTWYAQYNDINVVIPYLENQNSLLTNEYLKIIDSSHLFYDYGYTYQPSYKVNDVEVGMFWLQPGNTADPSSGFIITKSLIRNYGSDTTLENLEVTNLETQRYMYTIPSSLLGQYIYNSNTGSYMTTGQVYPSKLGSSSFKNSTVAKGFTVDVTFGDGITEIPSSAFLFAEFKSIYANNVTTLQTSCFQYSKSQIFYGFKVESIGSNAFYWSSLKILDLRQNKEFNEETNEWETIFVTFNNYFLYYSSIQAIYVNEGDLDTYVERTKGSNIFVNSNDEYDYLEVYAFIKALGTHVGEINLKYDSTYDIESIISPYVDDETTESIEWIVVDGDSENRITCDEGEISVNEDPSLDNGEKYQEGSADIYCIRHKSGSADELLGKFHVIISSDDTTVEYYNFAKSLETREEGSTTFNGYRIISYYGTAESGELNPSEMFNDFMYSHVTAQDRSNYAILNYLRPSDSKYTVFELAVGSYMSMTVPNETVVNLYTDKYITKISDYAFYSSPVKEIWLSNVTQIGRRAFLNYSSTNSLLLAVMPEVETIEYQAFYQNYSLTNVVIGDMNESNLTTVGSYAFGRCIEIAKFGVVSYNLTDATNVNHIYYNMESYLGSFDTLNDDTNHYVWVRDTYSSTDEHNVTTYYYSYYDFEDLGNNYYILYLPNSIRSIGERAFYQLNLIDEIRYPNTEEYTTVPYRAFESMKDLHYVRLGQYVTSIGQEAFAYCENLVSTPYDDLTAEDFQNFEYYLNGYYPTFTSPHNMNSTFLYSGIVKENSNHESLLDGIDLSNIKTIGYAAFKQCYQLNNLYLDSIESIGSEAFAYCSSLRYISFELNQPEDDLTISFGSKWDYSTHDLRRYYVSSVYKDRFTSAIYIYEREGALLEFAKTSNYVLNYVRNPLNTSEILGVKIVCYNGEQIEQIPTSFHIGTNDYSILKIGAYAYHGFGYQMAVDTIYLPSTVTNVESHAFDGTMFSYYEELPNTNSSVDYGDYVFNGNTKLIEAKFTRMNSGGKYFFNNCASLSTMDLQDNYVNGVYAAPILEDEFFNGSPSRAKCTIKADMNYLFTATAYLNRIYEESEMVDVDNIYSVKVDSNDNVTILHYIGTDAIGTGGDYTIPTTLQLKDQGSKVFNVIAIGDGAFKDSDVVNRTNLIIGSNITSIGKYAFYNTRFGSVTFTGSNLNTTIGEYAFAAMPVLMSADVSALNSLGSSHGFYDDEYLSSFTMNYSVITSIPDYYFAECNNLQSLQIGDSLVSIGNNSFENCSTLKVIQLKDITTWEDVNTYNLGNVTSVGDYAFNGCISMVRIIAFKLKSMGAYAFKNCNNFKYVNLDSTLNFIGEGAFYACTSLTSADAYTTYIPDYCYYGCTSITTVDTTGARSIGKYAFYQCTSLEYVDLLNVKVLSDYAFYKCENLAEVTMNSVTSIGGRALSNCALSGELTISQASSIGNYAFASNLGITKITFNSTKYIGAYAFYNDTQIEEFDFTDNKDTSDNFINPTQSGNAFSGINDTFFIYVDGSVLASYESAYPSWKHRIYERGNIYKDNTNVEYMVKTVVDGYEIIRYMGTGITGTYKVPETINGTTVVSIGRYAYYNALSSSSANVLNLGTYITNVGRYAFYNFDFETISMPNVKTIGNYAFANNEKLGYLSLESAETIYAHAFYNNTNLKLVRLYDTLTTINEYAFGECESLRSVYMANTNLTSLNVPYNGRYMFGTLSTSEVIIRVPTTMVDAYKSKMPYYRDRIKAGELDEADFSYRTVTENGEDVIEIIAYEGQNTKVTIKAVIEGKRVTRILANAFENSLNLEIVEIPDTLMSISSHAFMGNSTIKNVRVYSDDESKYDYASLFTDNRLYFVSYDGVLYMNSMVSVGGTPTEKATTLVYYPIAKTDTSYSFTTSVAGGDLSNLNTVYENAFYGNTYIEEIYIPYRIRKIGENAFAYCPSLKGIEFIAPESGSLSVPTIYGTNILTNCDSELCIIVNNSYYLNLFLADEYFSFYKDKFTSSWPVD